MTHRGPCQPLTFCDAGDPQSNSLAQETSPTSFGLPPLDGELGAQAPAAGCSEQARAL